MISLQIAIWRTTIAVMFLLFIVVVVFPTVTFVLARFAIGKGEEIFSM